MRGWGRAGKQKRCNIIGNVSVGLGLSSMVAITEGVSRF